MVRSPTASAQSHDKGSRVVLVNPAALALNSDMKIFSSLSVGAGLAIVIGGTASAMAAQDDWPRWRGPNDNGSIAAGRYAVKWESEQVLWKARLPGKGCSTPVIWKQRIYLTAPAN